MRCLTRAVSSAIWTSEEPVSVSLFIELYLVFHRTRFAKVEVFDPIDLSLRDLTTVSDRDSSMEFLAEAPDGTRLKWVGDLRTQPLESQGRLEVVGLPLERVADYYGAQLNFDVGQGTLGLSLDYAFDLRDLERVFVVDEAQLSVRELDATGINGAPLARLGDVEVSGLGFSFPEMELQVGGVLVRDGLVRVELGPEGGLNWGQLIRAPEPVSEAPARDLGLPELNYAVDVVRLEAIEGQFLDLSGAGDVGLLTQVSELEVRGISSEPSARVEWSVRAALAGGGRLVSAGKLAGETIDLEVELSEMGLDQLEGYAAAAGVSAVRGGVLDARARLSNVATGELVVDGAAAVRTAELSFGGGVCIA